MICQLSPAYQNERYLYEIAVNRFVDDNKRSWSANNHNKKLKIPIEHESQVQQENTKKYTTYWNYIGSTHIQTPSVAENYVKKIRFALKAEATKK